MTAPRRNEVAPLDLTPRLELALAYVEAVRHAPERRYLRSLLAQTAAHQQPELEGARS